MIALKVPILKQGDMLIVSIQDALTDADLLTMRDHVVEAVTLHRSRYVVMDVAGLDVLDSFSVHTFSATARMIRLRGAETLVVGIQPSVALAMVRLRLDMEGIRIMLDLEDALEYLDRIPPPAVISVR